MSEAVETSTTRRGALGHVLGAAFTVPLVATMCMTADTELITLGRELRRIEAECDRINVEEFVPADERYMMMLNSIRAVIGGDCVPDEPRAVLELTSGLGSVQEKMAAASAELRAVASRIEARPWSTAGELVVRLRAMAVLLGFSGADFDMPEQDMEPGLVPIARMIQQAERIAAAA